MNFKEWVLDRDGKYIDFDNMYGVQCVDLVDDYIVNCIGISLGFYGNAKEWWLQRQSNSWLQSNFTSHSYSECQVGDIGVRTSGGGGNGHIFVIIGLDNKGNALIYDENGGGNNDPVTRRTIALNSDNISGVLRYNGNIDMGGYVDVDDIDFLFKKVRIRKGSRIKIYKKRIF